MLSPRRSSRLADSFSPPVNFLSHTNSFTPSFAPTYDSTLASGGWSFHSTSNAAWAASSSRQWIESGWNANYTEDGPDATKELDADDQEIRERAIRAAKLLQDDNDDLAIDPALLDALETQQAGTREVRTKLDQNARDIQKLSRKQDERLRRGEMSVSDPEEHALGKSLWPEIFPCEDRLPSTIGSCSFGSIFKPTKPCVQLASSRITAPELSNDGHGREPLPKHGIYARTGIPRDFGSSSAESYRRKLHRAHSRRACAPKTSRHRTQPRCYASSSHRCDG